jgi:predicted kinase
MQTLYIVRGLPGSGKSTLASKLAPAAHFEADRFFVGRDGRYRFDPRYLQDAHRACYKQVEEALAEGAEKVAVSNTFTQAWELEQYLRLPDFFPGLRVEVIRCTADYGNVHGVPGPAIEKMRARFDDHPGETIVGPGSIVVPD